MSDNPNVTDRTPEAPVNLRDLGAKLMSEAREHDAGRSALTLTPSEGGPLKQTLIALTAGQDLTEDIAGPGPAAVEVISGAATLDSGNARLESGAWSPLALDRQALHAEEDVCLLLTVVPNP